MKHLRVIAAALLVTAGVVRAGDPFVDAEISPPDVKLYVHVEGAAAIRAALADRPFARWIDTLLGRGQLPAAWQRFCAAAGSPAGGLFDACLGRRVTLLWRGGEPPEWVLITDIDPPESAALLQRLQAQILAPRNDAGLFQLPAQDFLVARSERSLLVAPLGQPALLYDVLPRLARPAGIATLAAEPALADFGELSRAEGRRLGDGSAAIALRHAPPLGGWSVGVAQVAADRIAIRQVSRFEAAPFRSRVSALTWDPAPLACLQSATFLAFIEPTDIAGGPLDAFMQAALGETGVASALGSNLGPRQVTAVSDRRDAQQPAILPGVARAYEVIDANAAWNQIDAYMARLLPSLSALAPGAASLERPGEAALVSGQARCVDASALARALAGDLPGAGDVKICWTVVKAHAAASGWCVIASDPGHLENVGAALRAEACGQAQANPGPPGLTSCGSLDGRRLSAHLARWRGAVEAMARPPDAPAIVDTLDLLAEFAAGVQSGNWRLVRPSAECLHAEAELVLAPPESDGSPPTPAAPGP